MEGYNKMMEGEGYNGAQVCEGMDEGSGVRRRKQFVMRLPTQDYPRYVILEIR